MDYAYLEYTDKELVALAEDKSTTREARREIARRKRVGSWRLIANWQPDKEVVQEERVYAPGVKR